MFKATATLALAWQWPVGIGTPPAAAASAAAQACFEEEGRTGLVREESMGVAPKCALPKMEGRGSPNERGR